MAATTVIAAGALGGWRAALGGIGFALLAGLAAGYGPALMGAGVDADRCLLGLTLLLCGGVPAVMALAQERRARPVPPDVAWTAHCPAGGAPAPEHRHDPPG